MDALPHCQGGLALALEALVLRAAGGLVVVEDRIETAKPSAFIYGSCGWLCLRHEPGRRIKSRIKSGNFYNRILEVH